MPPLLTAEDIVNRIAAECPFVDERGAVGILEPTAAIAGLSWEIAAELSAEELDRRLFAAADTHHPGSAMHSMLRAGEPRARKIRP
jgi:hypothetical protein